MFDFNLVVYSSIVLALYKFIIIMIKNRRLHMCNKHLGQCFVLTALHRLPSHSSPRIQFSKFFYESI